MLKRILKEMLYSITGKSGRHHRSYSSSDYHRQHRQAPRHGYPKYSSSDYKHRGHHSQHGSHHYRRGRHSSVSFFSS